MSRSSSLRQSLDLPQDLSFDVLAVEATGDCFYDCVDSLLSHENFTPISSEPTPPLLLRPNTDRLSQHTLSAQSMRDYVADQLTTEQFELYQMFATAGVDDFAWMSNRDAPKSLEELQEFARRSGKTHGPGKCFWADEFALRTISDGLALTLLIIDEQSTRRGGTGRKRKRAGDVDLNDTSSAADGRFISIGAYPRAIILHRSRRQHYNAIVVGDRPILNIANLPICLISLWPMVISSNGGGAVAQKAISGPIKSCEEGQVEASSVGKSQSSCNNESCRGKKDNSEQVNGTTKPNLEESDQKPPTTSQSPSNPGGLAQSPRTNNTRSTQLGRFYCGCAGFANSSWVGNMYPKSIVGHNSDRQIDHYQQYFSTVEINSTFYGVPSESTVLKWKQQFAKNFKVVVKAPKALTHERDFLDGSILTHFLSRMQPLNDNLACVLIQCPRTLVVDAEQLQKIKREMVEQASWYKGYLAFEFRNEATFYNQSVRDFLGTNKNWTLVLHPNSLGRSTIGTSVSGRGNSDLLEYEPEKLSVVASKGIVSADSKFVYLRLHGSNDEHRGEYTLDQLCDISNQIHSWRVQGIDVYSYILNDLEPTQQSPLKKSGSSASKQSSRDPWEKWCAMPKNAKQLEKLVFGLSKESVPSAPKMPKSTILNFFAKNKGPKLVT